MKQVTLPSDCLVQLTTADSEGIHDLNLEKQYKALFKVKSQTLYCEYNPSGRNLNCFVSNNKINWHIPENTSKQPGQLEVSLCLCEAYAELPDQTLNTWQPYVPLNIEYITL